MIFTGHVKKIYGEIGPPKNLNFEVSDYTNTVPGVADLSVTDLQLYLLCYVSYY